MYCTGCGKPIAAGAKFCGDCGARNGEQPGSTVAASYLVGEGAGALVPHHRDPDAPEIGPSATASPTWKPLRGRISFVFLYLTLIVPTYVLPYFGSNSGFLNAVGGALGSGVLPQFWMHVTALVGAIVIAWYRGLYVGMPWLPVLPFFAAIFDLTPGLNWLFLVPTSFHVAAMITGAIRDPRIARLPAMAFRLGIAALVMSSLITVYRFATFSIPSPSAPVSAPSSGGASQEVPSDAPPTAVGSPRSQSGQSTRWRVSALPVAQGLADPMPRISTLTLLNEMKRAVPYQVQYVPHGFLNYVADHLRARRPIELSSAPDGFPGSESKVAVAAGATVRVIEIFTDVHAPLALHAEKAFDMILPFTLTETALSGAPYSISQGTLVVPVHATGSGSECSTFLLSTSDFIDLCWPSSDVPLKANGGKSTFRTAFLVELDGGRRAWTSYIDEEGPPENWLAADWISCQSVVTGSDTKVVCNE